MLVLGHLGMAYEGNAATQSMTGEITRDNTALQIFYFSLSLIIVGVGFLKTNISSLVGELYETGDKREIQDLLCFTLESTGLAFTLICVWLGENTAGVMVVQLESECFLIIDFYFRKKLLMEQKENRTTLRFRDKIIRT
jgi:dipeptide/tripeptide permease